MQNALCMAMALLKRQHHFVKKLLLMTKFTALILVLACGAVSARGYTQAITLSLKKAPLEKVFSEIKKQTPYTFIYYKPDLTNTAVVDISVTNASVETVLAFCFQGQPLTYTIEDRTIVIKRKPAYNIPHGAEATPENEYALLDVRGSVVNEKGDPVAGAAVQVKNSRMATNTDDAGRYELHSVNANAILVFSGINIETYETKINGRTEISVAAVTKISRLQDVVVNKGYYSTSQRLNTGSVSKVTSETIGRQPVLNPLQALQGRVPGLVISQTTGMAGSNYTVQIRGQNSLRNSGSDYGNFPLYVVDGVPFMSAFLNIPGLSPYSRSTLNTTGTTGVSPLNSINPADIESIEVLKDADATSIYGSRGANGVILITTKRGKTGRMRVDVNVYTGVGDVTRKLKMLNTKQYLQMRKEAFKNDGTAPLASDYDVNGAWDTTRYTDWQKVLMGGTAHTTDAELSIAGGNTNTQYRIGGGYHRETTVFPGDFADQRASTQLSLNASSPDQRFKTGVTINYAYGVNNMPFSDLSATALSLAPDAPALYDSLGKLNWQNNTFTNPLGPTQQPYDRKTNNLIGNATLSYEIWGGITLKANLGYTNTTMKEMNRRFSASMNPVQAAITGLQSNFGNSTANSWLIEPQLNWHKETRLGNINVLAGSTFQEQEREQTKLSASGFLSEAVMNNIAFATQSTISSAVAYSKYKYNAVFGRISYEKDKKYLLNLTARRDGSSRFGPDKQFANFASAGIGWIFSEEGFIAKALPFLSYGKIRGSYGTTGNDQIPDYGYLDGYAVSGNYLGTPALVPQRLYNPDYSWEVNKKLEAAMELGFLKDRIMLTAAWYRNRSSNQLVGYVLPPTTGFTSIQYNLPALVQNTGLEIELNTTNIKTKAFTWSSSFNISFPKNKLVSYPNLKSSAYAFTYVIGEPLSISNVYHFTGVDPQTGLYTIEDIDKSNSYTAADKMPRFVGQRYYGGLQNSINYKGFQLDLFFQFVKQAGKRSITGYPGGPANQPLDVLNHWQKAGDNNTGQLFSNTFAAQSAYLTYYAISDGAIVDASYIRLKNLSLSYQLPTTLMQKAKVQSIRLYIQGQNLLTVTSYTGLDPENIGLGLPPLRMLTAGIQITL